jgi:hypothetical protein
MDHYWMPKQRGHYSIHKQGKMPAMFSKQFKLVYSLIHLEYPYTFRLEWIKNMEICLSIDVHEEQIVLKEVFIIQVIATCPFWGFQHNMHH